MEQKRRGDVTVAYAGIIGLESLPFRYRKRVPCAPIEKKHPAT